MCLAVPVRVREILDDNKIRVESKGVNILVSSIFIPDIKIGEYIIVHAGFALSRIEKEDAEDRIDIIGKLKNGKPPNE